MSAEIISLQAWRRKKNCEHREPATPSMSFPCLWPTWPFGWLQPMLVEIDVSGIAEFNALVTHFASQTNSGGLFNLAPGSHPVRDNRKRAAIHHLSWHRRQRNMLDKPP